MQQLMFPADMQYRGTCGPLCLERTSPGRINVRRSAVGVLKSLLARYRTPMDLVRADVMLLVKGELQK